MCAMAWKKRRGRLGVLQPLLGTWVAEADSPQGRVRCTRRFERVLGGSYVQLTARWEFADTVYEELALYGVDKDRELRFWSFTSDGKQFTGVLADGSDAHPQALAFEAQMPAGLARTLYWPDEEEGFRWAVESHGMKGWNRFVEHHYRAVEEARESDVVGASKDDAAG